MHCRIGICERIIMKNALNPGFFQRLMTPEIERDFIDGLRAMNENRIDDALATLENSADLPDSAWTAGMLRLKQEDFAAARRHLERALRDLPALGALYGNYDICARISIPVTAEVLAHVCPDEHGTLLALAEVEQFEGRPAEAIAYLDRLLELEPNDPVALASLAELALDNPGEHSLMERVVKLTAGVPNETPVDTAILYYRAKALSALGLPDAAIKVLTLANRRRKNRPAALMRQIRYDRACLYEQTGRRAQARREFEKLYADDPEFEDVAQRLKEWQ